MGCPSSIDGNVRPAGVAIPTAGIDAGGGRVRTDLAIVPATSTPGAMGSARGQVFVDRSPIQR